MEDPLWWAAEFEWRGFFHSSCWNWTCVGICGIQGSSYLWYREQCLVNLLSAYLKNMAWWGGEWGAHWGGKLSVPLSGQFHMFMLCLGYVWGIWLRCPFLPKSRRQTITSYLETFVLHSQLLGIVVGDCNTHCQGCHTVFIPGCGLNLYSAFLGSKFARLFLNCPKLGKEPRPTQKQDS